jgi:predicted secreted protein
VAERRLVAQALPVSAATRRGPPCRGRAVRVASTESLTSLCHDVGIEKIRTSAERLLEQVLLPRSCAAQMDAAPPAAFAELHATTRCSGMHVGRIRTSKCMICGMLAKRHFTGA